MKSKFHINASNHSFYMGNQSANLHSHPILFLLFYNPGKIMEDPSSIICIIIYVYSCKHALSQCIQSMCCYQRFIPTSSMLSSFLNHIMLGYQWHKTSIQNYFHFIKIINLFQKIFLPNPFQASCYIYMNSLCWITERGG